MRKESTESRSESRPEWEQLEDWVRSQVQRLIQELLEEEVTAFLGRAKSALRSDSDNDTGYRNGYGRARRLTLSSGTIQLRRPRVRDTEEQFESRLLPLFVNRTRKVAELIPELYLHGLSEGDFDLALRGLLGEDAPVSASTVARLKSKWNDELAQWRNRPLDDLEVVYMWVDGVYVKAGFEKEKAAVLVVMAALSDGSKVVVSAVPGYRESTENWSEVLRDIKRRGLSCPRLVVGDGHLGIWGALRNVYPQAAEQRCWNHKIVNVLAKLPKRQQDQAKLMLRTIPYAPTRTEAERLRTVFTRWCGDHSYEAASEALERDWDRMVTFYDFPKEHWGHLRTTNPVESPFAALRLRTDAAKRYKRVDRAIAVIWKMLMVAEQRFRRLKAPELIEDVLLRLPDPHETGEGILRRPEAQCPAIRGVGGGKDSLQHLHRGQHPRPGGGGGRGDRQDGRRAPEKASDGRVGDSGCEEAAGSHLALHSHQRRRRCGQDLGPHGGIRGPPGSSRGRGGERERRAGPAQVSFGRRRRNCGIR